MRLENSPQKILHSKTWKANSYTGSHGEKIKRFFYVDPTFDVTKFLYKLLPTKKTHAQP